MLSKKIKKLIPYCLILIAIIGVGFLGGVEDANAQLNLAKCTTPDGTSVPFNGLASDCAPPNIYTPSNTNPPPVAGTGYCKLPGQTLWTGGYSSESCINQGGQYSNFLPDPSAPTPPPDNRSAIEKMISGSCSWYNFTFQGCLLSFSYMVIHGLSAWLLWISAQFFNALVAISLSSQLFMSSTFVSEAWAVVRDLSNIFFILILLYIAIEMILGIGHNGKKMIAQVVIMALLINFSMFFTKVVIDTSNVLASIFYNKLEVETKANGRVDEYKPASSNPNEKNLSGAMVYAFDPTKLLTDDFLNQAKKQVVFGKIIEDDVPFGILFGLIVLSGAIMVVAAYAFFVSGFAFLARFIELWILTIFSPFAFMSSTIPLLSGVPDIGWKQWFDRLLAASFMAPVFMFFMYIIFKLLDADIFGGFIETTEAGFIARILKIIIPAAVIIVLLLKAMKFAKKASGQMGEMVTGALKMAAAGTGLVAGGALIGGAAIARFGGGLASSKLATLEGKSGKDALHIGKAMKSYDAEVAKWKQGGRVGDKPDWKTHLTNYQKDNKVQVQENVWTRMGGRINKSQLRSDEIGHARHELDEVRKKAGLEGVDPSKYTAAQQENFEAEFRKAKRPDLERDIRNGYDSKGREIKYIEKDANGVDVEKTVQSEAQFKEKRYEELRSSMLAGDQKANMAAGLVEKDKKGNLKLTQEGQTKINNQIGREFNENLKKLADVLARKKFSELDHEAKERVGYVDRTLAKSNSGSYDLRNLVEALKADKGAGFIESKGMALVGAVALGVRAGLKNGLGINAGTPSKEKDVWKDLANVLTESLKNMKINIKLPESAKHDDHGGGHGTGGGDHGGGHH